MTRQTNILLFRLGIVCLVAATFALALPVPFIFDDLAGIRDNEHMRSLWPLSQSLSAPLESPAYGRPVVALSLALTHAVAGVRPWAYHLFNIVIHIINALLVFELLRRTLTRIGFRGAPAVAFIITLLWALHPLHTETIAYASQRTELLFAMFCVLTLVCFERGRYVAAVCACALGMASKEVMVVVPLLVLLFDRTFISGDFRTSLARRRFAYIGLTATWLVLAALVVAFPRTDSAGFHHGHATGITAWTYLLTQSKVTCYYLTQVVWPTRLSVDIDFPIAASIRDVMLPGGVIVLLLALTVASLVRRPRWGFAGAWFFLLLAPTSSFVPIVLEIAAERRMYLPLLAIAVSVMLVIRHRAPRAFVPVGLVLAMALAGVTVERLRTYGDEITLYRDAVEKFPDNLRARRNLGSWYLKHRRFEEAVEVLEAVVRDSPGRPGVWHDLGLAYAQVGRLNDAGRCFLLAIADDPANTPVWENLARLKVMQGDLPGAEACWRGYVELMPGDPRGHNELGIVLARRGSLNEAIRAFERAVQLDPSFEDAVANLSKARSAFPAGE